MIILLTLFALAYLKDVYKQSHVCGVNAIVICTIYYHSKCQSVTANKIYSTQDNVVNTA